MWDIELEDGHLPSDSHAHSETVTKVTVTLLLDTRAFSSRWAIPKEKQDSLPTGQTIQTAEHAAEPQDDQRSDGASTIDPSHSASQVGYRGTTFSRFFPRPGGTQNEREDSVGHNEAAMPAVQPASHQRNPPEDLDDTVQNRMDHPAWDMPVDSLDPLHQDSTEPLLSPARTASALPLVRDKSPLPAIARPPSSTTSSNLRQEVDLGGSPSDACHVNTSHGTYLEYASSMSLNLPSSPLLTPISTGGLEPTDFEDQPPASAAHDWTIEFLELLGDEAPADLFLSNVAGHSLERTAGDDDINVGAYTELVAEEPSAFLGVDTWEPEDEGTSNSAVLCDPDLVEEEPYVLDCLQEYAPQDCGSARLASREGTPEEFYDIPYPRKRVKFADDVVCYEGDHGMADIDLGDDVWKWQPEPDINRAESDGLDEVGVSELGDPDGRSAGTAYPDPAPLDVTSQVDSAVAVEDESSQPEEDEGDVQSEMEEERSVRGSLQQFSQGRALLMGVASEIGADSYGTRLGVSAVEEEVARNLHGHWRPQRF